MKNKILFIWIFFFYIARSASCSEIDSAIQNLMEIVNNINIYNSILNTSRNSELEILEDMNRDYVLANEIIDNMYIAVNKNNSIHISQPLVIQIRDRINRASSVDRYFHIPGMKWLNGAGLGEMELDIIFDQLRLLRWLIANFPLDDTNAWTLNNDLYVSYFQINDSIELFSTVIEDIIFQSTDLCDGSSLIIEKIDNLIDIANNNYNSLFHSIVIIELDAIYQSINTKNHENLKQQLIKLDGLLRYISLIILYNE